MDSSFEQDRNCAKDIVRKAKYKCEYPDCYASFRREVAYDKHVFKVHTNIKAYQCTVEGCDKAYSNTSHLKRHIQVSHEMLGETTSVPCSFPSCDRSFASVWNMKRHHRIAHCITRKKHLCTECDMEFNKKSLLRIHIYSHTGDYPQKCADCNAGFLNLKQLRSHMCSKHSSSQKMCSECDTPFATWSELVGHRRSVHAAQYKCTVCERQFYSKCKLRLHEISHMSVEDLAVGGKLHRCSIKGCQSVYKRRSSLISHIHRKHNQNQAFSCEECQKEFSTKQKLQEHSMKKICQIMSKGKIPLATAVILSGLKYDPELRVQLNTRKSRDGQEYCNNGQNSCGSQTHNIEKAEHIRSHTVAVE